MSVAIVIWFFRYTVTVFADGAIPIVRHAGYGDEQVVAYVFRLAICCSPKHFDGQMNL